jgi:flagellar biosynthesis component FlhA
MSEHGMENKITKAHTGLLTKDEVEDYVDHYFDKQGVLHKEFLESELYMQVLQRLLKETSSVRP